MTDRVTIYDTTLRDGSQGTGISLSLHDKLSIARKLDEFGVDYIEGGWPGANPKDSQFFVAVREEGLQRARVSAFGSTRHAGIRAEDDAGLRLLLDAETPTVALVAKAWDYHVDAVLRTTLDENVAMVSDSVAYLKANGREVVIDAEHFFDGYRANRDYALAVLQAAADAGADWLVLCDTNGGSLPGQITEAVADAVGAFGSAVGIHAHNDGELAVANSLAAVAAGARQVQGTINGYGERTGNANLSSIVPNLVLKLGVECAAGDQLDRLTELSRYVDDVANVEPNVRLPFVGDAAFAHKGGIHVHAIAADPRTYEHLDPSAVGNRRHIVVSEQSGRSNVIERARELGLEVDPGSPAAKEVAAKLKELEEQGFQFEDAEASFELLVRRAADDYRPPFEPLAYAVDSRKGRDDDGSSSTASAEVGVGDEVLRGEATGLGPVNALEQAFRRALDSRLPTPRERLADRLPLLDRAQPRGNARADPRPHHRHRSGSRALDDGRELGRPAALELARAHRLSRVRDRDPRRDRSRAPGAAPRRRHTCRGAGGHPAAGARRRRRRGAGDGRRDRLDADEARPRRLGGSNGCRARDRARRRPLLQLRQLLRDRRAPALGFGQARQPAQRPAREPGRQPHLHARPLRAALRLVAATGRARPRTRARVDGRLLRARPDGLPRPGGAPRPRPPHLARRRAPDDADHRPGLQVPVERAARRDPDAGRRGLPLHHLRERLRRSHREGRGGALRPPRACRTTSAARTASS